MKEKYLFTIQNVETGKLNALVNNIMKQTGADDPNEAIRLVNSGEWTLTGPIRDWTEKNGIIRFSVISDGASDEALIARLEFKGFKFVDYVKNFLRSKSFKPTSGVVYEIVILKGELFSDDERITRNIRKKAKACKFTTPNAEVACLIREKLSDKELKDMRLDWIITAHRPIMDYEDVPLLLAVGSSDGSSLLSTCDGYPEIRWSRSIGFAFVVSKVSTS